MVNRAVRHYKN